jgi:hypothetical protein
VSVAKAARNQACSEQSQRLFRTVTALGAELRRQGAFKPAAGTVDLIDLAYVAIAAAHGQQKPETDGPKSLHNSTHG